MSLITVSHPWAVSVSASQSPGQIGPSFNVRFFPDRATPDLSWADFEPPPLTITLGGVTYSCLSQQKSVSIELESEGVVIEAQYYPQTLVLLKHTGPEKHIVYLSCRDYEYQLLEEKYNEDQYEVLHQETDAYCSKGWTLNAILDDIGNRSGVSITSLLPTLHVPNSTIILQRGQTYLSFIQRLLPSTFRYLWSIHGSSITVSLAGKGAGMSIPRGVYRLRVTESDVPEYSLIEIEGGEQRPGIPFPVGEDLSDPVNPQILTETLPAETHDDETTNVTQTYQTAIDGTTMFALLSRATTVTGPHVMRNGESQTVTIRETAETFEYELNDPVTFERPRQIASESTTKRFYTHAVGGKSFGSTLTYWLTDKGQILNSQEASGDETIVLTAYERYGEAETLNTSSVWVSQEEADANLPEGTEREVSSTRRQRYVKVNGIYYDALLSPSELLQGVLSDMYTGESGDISVSSISTTWKDAETVIRTLTVSGKGSSQFSRVQSVFNPSSGNMVSKTTMTPLNGRPQGTPTIYNTRPIRATIKSSSGGFIPGQGANVIPMSFSVPTNNLTDFEAWAALALEQATTPQRMVEMQAMNVFYPPGMVVGGITIESFNISVSDEGGEQITFGGRL